VRVVSAIVVVRIQRNENGGGAEDTVTVISLTNDGTAMPGGKAVPITRMR
jgi:hypothetical protein